MFKEEDNSRDSYGDLGLVVKDSPASITYTKIDKLITALYMVTDIIDKDEPLRNKLRTLGINIVSDINTTPSRALSKITEVMSFLDIASAMNIISQMNCSILRKEFLELEQAIKDLGDKARVVDRKVNLAEFFSEDSVDSHPSLIKDRSLSNGSGMHRLGVQKGSTLMKALSDKVAGVSDKHNTHLTAENFDALKKQRREDIINFIKILGGSATIKDIKDKAAALASSGHGSNSIASCGEKTLQRELVAMVQEGFLNKTGEKRWSRYSVK